MQTQDDTSAPMPSAPMKYKDGGEVDWGNMWDSFCVLAKEGGPPHRATMLLPQEGSNVNSEGYRYAVQEIVRGIYEVSRLHAEPASPGWIAVSCPSAEMARWVAESVVLENVQAHSEGSRLLVPVGERFTLKGEIKNVITAVAKTTHYWHDHVPSEIKSALRVEAQFAQIKSRLTGWLRRQPAAS